MPRTVIYLVRSWPRLSQTFVLNEVLALERRGVRLAVFSLVRSGEAIVHPQVEQVRAPITYLADECGRGWPVRIRRHARQLTRTPVTYARTLATCLRDRDLTAGYGECTALESFDMAVRVTDAVRRLKAGGSEPVHLHAHFAHDPALVGMWVARFTGLPFTFTAHARDLVQLAPPALAARAREAAGVFTCCSLNAEYLDSTLPGSVRPPVTVIRHGVDLRRFTPGTRHPATGVPTVVSVGRLVDKKGFADLLQALWLVKATGRAFRCEIYGDGPELDRLTSLRTSLQLDDEVHLLGARSGDGIVRALRDADLFALTPRVAADGDRDGIPNVLVEAMSCGLPVVTTTAGGVPELVDHDHNGLLARPGDVRTVATHLGELIDSAERRARLGAAARATVERSYDVDVAAQTLERLMLSARATPMEAVS
jgi:glycosyltransferase involved in cell wall biosynthesis